MKELAPEERPHRSSRSFFEKYFALDLALVTILSA
jgi:hypothetical protein